MYDWNNWRTLVALVIGVGGLVSFVLYSKFLRIDRGHDPLIRGSIFRSSTALASYLGTVLHGNMPFARLYQGRNMLILCRNHGIVRPLLPTPLL